MSMTCRFSPCLAIIIFVQQVLHDEGLADLAAEAEEKLAQM